MFKPKNNIKTYSLFILLFYACTTKVEVAEKSHTVVYDNKIFRIKYQLHEFSYKNHTYISCKIDNGISITHAGHCNCFKKSI